MPRVAHATASVAVGTLYTVAATGTTVREDSVTSGPSAQLPGSHTPRVIRPAVNLTQPGTACFQAGNAATRGLTGRLTSDRFSDTSWTAAGTGRRHGAGLHDRGRGCGLQVLQPEGGWMIPPEAEGKLLLLVQASDEDGTWSAGLVRTAEEVTARPGAGGAPARCQVAAAGARRGAGR
jgi:hypothetical protein